MTANDARVFRRFVYGNPSPAAASLVAKEGFDGSDAVEPEPVSLTFAERRQAIGALFKNLKINEISLEDLLHEAGQALHLIKNIDEKKMTSRPDSDVLTPELRQKASFLTHYNDLVHFMLLASYGLHTHPQMIAHGKSVLTECGLPEEQASRFCVEALALAEESRSQTNYCFTDIFVPLSNTIKSFHLNQEETIGARYEAACTSLSSNERKATFGDYKLVHAFRDLHYLAMLNACGANCENLLGAEAKDLMQSLGCDEKNVDEKAAALVASINTKSRSLQPTRSQALTH